MPLPPAQTQKLPIDGWQGIDIERGVLERAVSSFQLVENFDLVKHGVVRKIRGNQRVAQVSGNPLIALRDFQTEFAGVLKLIIVVDNMGLVYALNQEDFSVVEIGRPLYSPPGVMDSAPFLVSLPLADIPTDGTVNYVFITIGTKGTVKKWDGTALPITDVGIPNPGDTWAVLYQNSVVVPQIFYNNITLGKPIYQYTSPDSTQGIPDVVGRRYRATWYNPITGHDSSLFPLSLTPWPTQLDVAPPPESTTKSLGTVYTTQDAQYLMAVPLFLDNLPNRLPLSPAPFPPVTIPQDGYSKIRFWRTLDGGTEFFLLPRIYDYRGNVVSDDNGAVDIVANNLVYGFNNPVVGGTLALGLYDGFIPHVNTVGDIPVWWNPLSYDGESNYTVNGSGQSGDHLNVTYTAGGPLSSQLSAGQFMLPGDTTIYVIEAVTNAGATFRISPDLAFPPNAGAQLTFLFTQPVQDQELVVPFVTAAETGVNTNQDRLNDPPPMASWGVVYQNRLLLLDATNPTRIVYSRINNYESFPPENEFVFSQADFDPITALLAGRQIGLVSQGADQQLVVGKSRETAKITGTDANSFAITSMFSETGIVHKRAAVVVEGDFVAWTRRGLEDLAPQSPVYIGAKIKDLFDQATFQVNDIFGPSFTTFRREGELLLGINLNRDSNLPNANLQGGRIDTILLMRPAVPIGASAVGGMVYYESPFTLVTALPTYLGILLESGIGDDVKVLGGGNDGWLYEFFTGGTSNPGLDPVVGLLQTQLLPQDDKDSRKIFRRIRFGGNVITGDVGWKVQFSVDDGNNFTPPTRMFNETMIGLVGKQLIVQIIHDREVMDNEELPQISNMTLEYVPIGTSRGEPI